MTDDGSYRQVLGDPPADLAPPAREQWDEVLKDAGSFHRWIRSQVGARHHADDVLSAAKRKFYVHLRKNGPVSGNPREYFGKICRNAARDHFAYLKKLSEDFFLDDASPGSEKWREDSAPDKDLLALVEVRDQLRGGLRILKEELTSTELTAYILREAHKYDTAAIAEYTGSTQDAVRQSLMRARKKLKGPALKRKLFLFNLVPE